MLLVKTHAGPSEIQGTGLFAAEPIKKGTPVWRFDKNFDREFTENEMARFPALARAYLDRYAYKSRISGKYILCVDSARHFNHSTRPNIGPIIVEGEQEDVDIALRDISEGEELTFDYRFFDEPLSF